MSVRDDVELLERDPEDSVDERQSELECLEYSFCVRGQCLEGPPPPRSTWSLFQYFAQLVCLKKFLGVGITHIVPIHVDLVGFELGIEDQERFSVQQLIASHW